MNEQELQLAVIGYIMATKKQPKSEQEVQAIAQEVAGMKQSNPQQYQQLVQMGQQAQQQQAGAKVAALGSKLNYIKKIKGLCPEGEELVYMKQGGRMCPVCQKKAEKAKDGKKVGNSVSQWKADRAKAKDEAARDSIAINKYNDQETMIEKGHKGKFNPNKKNESGGATWEPNRSNYKKAEKNACGSKMKKKK